MSRIFLYMGVRVESDRVPFKSIRLIGGKPLFQVALDKWRHYVSADGELIYVHPDPSNDLVAYVLMSQGCNVLRHGYPVTVLDEFIELYNLQDDDIIVPVRIDEPLQPIEDIQFCIEKLKETGKDTIITVPTDTFPIRDWEWALGPPQNRAYTVDFLRLQQQVVYPLGSPGRLGDAQEATRLLLKSGLIHPLFVEKPRVLKRPWPYQPLWIDEPGQFEKVKLILESFSEMPTSEQIWRLLEEKPEIKMMACNAMRRTMKYYYEHEEIVEVLRNLVRREGVVSVENKVVPGAERIRPIKRRE